MLGWTPAAAVVIPVMVTGAATTGAVSVAFLLITVPPAGGVVTNE